MAEEVVVVEVASKRTVEEEEEATERESEYHPLWRGCCAGYNTNPLHIFSCSCFVAASKKFVYALIERKVPPRSKTSSPRPFSHGTDPSINRGLCQARDSSVRSNLKSKRDTRQSTTTTTRSTLQQ